ncbi:metallophosphoesterase [uncultured Gimesia sp.]|mgnify:CR=1 FL=1|uniref:metallophosphoesterase n=1 Tax=uncultured Gimesia sp. TaxID=1678688 RepID=UPI0030DB174B|tara:strand:- start:77561 stop:78607 length:1047 start_codon:yes stop_codon:yes gene_type:complete
MKLSKIVTTLFAIAAYVLPVHADELPPVEEGSFSLAIIPDTQHYQGKGTNRKKQAQAPTSNPVFEAITDCIIDELQRQRIVFVSHVGDIVDRNNDEQWTVAQKCMNKLQGKVPYGISVGNHDMITKTGDSSLFQKYFPQSRFSKFDWYGGCYKSPNGQPEISGNNANSFQLFSAGDMDFLFLHLECNAPDSVLAWADKVLEQHSDRRAIITTHMGLGPLNRPKQARDYFDTPKGRMTWKKCHGTNGNTSQQMWDKCFSKHKNLFMICCGDQSRTQALHQSVKGQHGNTVHELLSDYGSNGFRLMKFIPDQNKIEVRTWNPVTQEYCEKTSIVPERDQHQFTLEYQMTK